jgi:hypothetical protein
LTLLVVGAGAYTGLVLLRPWGGLRRLYGLFPAVRGGLAGLVVATLLAGAFDGVGVNVTGAAFAVVLPVTVLAVLRVQHHAEDRTQPPHVGPAPAPAPAGVRVARPAAGGRVARPPAGPGVTVKSRGSIPAARQDDQAHLRHGGRRVLPG